jgi:hypothetical protein
MPGRDMLVPKINELLQLSRIGHIQVIYRWCTFYPQKSMDMTAAMVLPFITPLKVFNLEFDFHIVLKVHFKSLLKVIGRYCRIFVEILHPYPI